ncbi:biotin--[acetyl-CoA-carboxylase] ligase [Sediminibacillus albus]|uniref:Bifunctional ligase/repressor BirA n=1 Tax=Sediminibacillus albus TaxID=407036 RepID=A0A1G8VP12_9BACI|nr:biotin--[acetyl-CoA-carboxylase] ligase [Sediminibacillus albus]SDJ67808.1 BirA family transcriptional regulator, biotin operon repressor / biotin-[acetyl-CoA-carboxylase] ligase [Sediminibacillus albus]
MSTTRNQLIELLENNQQEYISGQQLCERLNISRTAVWKHMKELEKDGYRIVAVPKRGYRIIEFPDKLSKNTLQWGLQTSWLGRNIVHYPEISSTQKIGHQLALEGAAEGTVIIADQQTEGKGRMGRKWHSAKNEGIWMSIILRPQIIPQLAPQITLMTAVILAKAIETVTEVSPAIKWPNDIFINNRKTAGILTEMQAEQDEIQYIVLGIGINVNQSRDNLPEDIQKIATSIKQESGKQWRLVPLIQEIFIQFEQKYETFLQKGFTDIKEEWEMYGYKIGEQVRISSNKLTYPAKLIGLETDGALKVQKQDGSTESIYSAEILW